MAGGGSTVRGVADAPDKDDPTKKDDPIKPFVSMEYKGKKGTVAVMADGKVRFIAADMKPAIFRSLCTIAGGERMDDINEIAPVVPDEDALQESKAAAVVASAPAQQPGSQAPAASTARKPSGQDVSSCGNYRPDSAGRRRAWHVAGDANAGLARS